MPNYISASAIRSILYAKRKDPNSVAIAEIDASEWDGKYPAYFTRTSNIFSDEYSIDKEHLTYVSWLEDPSNTPEYSRAMGGAGRVWVPLERIEGYQDRETHFNYNAKKRHPRKLQEPDLIDRLGAQRGEGQGRLLNPETSVRWTAEVSVRLKALEEERRQKEAVPSQGDYLEDWEGIPIKEGV